MSRYNSFEEINRALKQLKLQQAIATEEMKGIKYQLQNDLQPLNLIGTALNVIKKYGIIYFVKKWLR